MSGRPDRPRRVPLVAALAAVTCATGSFSAAPAKADLRDECATASERGQFLKSQGKLVSARAALLLCSRAACPAVVKSDCDSLLSEVDASLPSIVVSAKDPTGNDAVAVRVIADGSVVREKLDGLPIPLDPGEHDVRLELARAKPTTVHVLLPEGMKNRAIHVVFEAEGPAPHPRAGTDAVPPLGGATPGPPPPSAPAERPRASPLAYALTTLGGAGIGAYAFFQVRAVIESHHLRQTCAPDCPASSVGYVSDDVLASRVSLAGGLALGAAGAALFIFAPWPSSRTTAAIGPTGLTVQGSF